MSSDPMIIQLVSSLSRCGDTGFGKGAFSTPVMIAYFISGSVAFMVYNYIAAGSYSSVLTMSAIVQCLGFTFLCIQVVSSGSAAGISASALKLDALAVCMRLSSTTWLNGYLPVDKSGDHAYQILDICSLCMMLFILHRVLVVNRSSYQLSEDTFTATPTVVMSLVFAAMLHGNMDRHPLFDTLWMAGLFTEVVAVLPQLWLITQSGGGVEPLTSHHIACLALSRVLSGLFMWEARYDITCTPWISGVQHAILVILLAHAVHLLLLVDFTYYYVCALVKSGPSKRLELGEVFI